MRSNQKSNRVIFLVAIILGVSLAAFLLYDRQAKVKIATPAKQANIPDASNDTNVFEKPGTPTQNYQPVTPTKTTAQLEAATQNQASSPSDYNSLAMSYHTSGDQTKALQTINDGLAKYPNDKSLLLTKDMIENPNF